MYLKHFFREKNIIVLLLLATIMLSLPYLIRASENNDNLIRGEPYYHARMSQAMTDQGMQSSDALSFGGRDYLFNPFHYIMGLLISFLGLMLAAKLLPLILGLASLLVFYLILKKLRLESKKIFLICAILIFTPIFIYTFTVLNSHALVILLVLLGFYFFMHKSKTIRLISLLVLMTLPLFSLFSALIALLALLVYSLHKKNIKNFYPVLFFLLAISAIYYVPEFIRQGIPSYIVQNIRVDNFISDIGGIMGFSVFSIILACVGLFFVNKKKSFIFLIAALFALSFYFGSQINLYLNFIVVVLAGEGFFRLIQREWESKILRNFSIIVLVCGIMFSPISYTKELSSSLPDQAVVDSLIWLKENSDKDDVVFSAHEKGFWIEYFAQRPAVMDNLFEFAPQLKQRAEDSSTIFKSNNLDITRVLLDKYDIRYIWIDPAMKKQLWNNKRTALLFLLSNSETFKNVYEQDNIEVWEYLKKE